jgi:hypothetical protein
MEGYVMNKESLEALKPLFPRINKKRNRRKIHQYFPINKNGELYCPNDNTKLEHTGHFVGMMDAYRIGNEGENYVCPKCKQPFWKTTIFRD